MRFLATSKLSADLIFTILWIYAGIIGSLHANDQVTQLPLKELESALIRVQKDWNGGIRGPLSFVVDGNRVRLVDSEGVSILVLNALECVDQVVFTKNKKRMLLRVSKLTSIQPKIRSFNYSRLVMVWTDSPSNTRHKSFLQSGIEPMIAGRQWIAAIGALEDDDATVSVKVGAIVEGEAIYKWRRLNIWTGDTVLDKQ